MGLLNALFMDLLPWLVTLDNSLTLWRNMQLGVEKWRICLFCWWVQPCPVKLNDKMDLFYFFNWSTKDIILTNNFSSINGWSSNLQELWMLVDEQRFQTYSSLKNKQDVIPSQNHGHGFVELEPCFHYSYQATIYQICNHKECLPGAQDTCS